MTGLGKTFPRVLRGILRHDPNVILIGEIRDEETAEIAVRAAQVGRLVLSTLHTNAAAGAVTRLVDLGVPAFLVRDVLRGVLRQELLVGHPLPGLWWGGLWGPRRDGSGGAAAEGGVVGGVRGCPESGRYFLFFVQWDRVVKLGFVKILGWANATQNGA